MRTNVSGTVVVLVAVTAMAMTARAEDNTSKWSKTDRLLIQAQKICPVSGKILLSMGGPVRAKLGDREVFLCCRGCLGKEIPKQHWATVQANWIATQAKCPVMNRPLPQNPASITVEGRTVFVCCPPCTRKIKADPDKYLSVVDGLLEKQLSENKSLK